MAKLDRIVIYPNTEKEKENYRKLQSVLALQSLSFSKWGNKVIKFYLDNKLNFNENNKKSASTPKQS